MPDISLSLLSRSLYSHDNLSIISLGLWKALKIDLKNHRNSDRQVINELTKLIDRYFSLKLELQQVTNELAKHLNH